ncbi:hypothetical protein CYMTET_54443 [Cymbomonas tetramitiformis]|uniref:Uncharacterized protein n=1 Tax=Cymbomonas tetramitiformis TaxID=36881 RepID=A0AAE0BGQ3_9CHLO|nr:hypothetical protein CYMTET_54443 [Cymbomonas tetramitiformis]
MIRPTHIRCLPHGVRTRVKRRMEVKNAALSNRALRRLEKTRDMFSKAKSGAHVLIDCNNVRAAKKFEWSPEDIFEGTRIWAKDSGFTGRVLFVLDHGPQQKAFVQDDGTVLVLSGPIESADDIIAREIGLFLDLPNQDVFVITADQRLMGRYYNKYALQRADIHTVPSIIFVWMLESALARGLGSARAARLIQTNQGTRSSLESKGAKETTADRITEAARLFHYLEGAEMEDAIVRDRSAATQRQGPSRALQKYLELVNAGSHS